MGLIHRFFYNYGSIVFIEKRAINFKFYTTGEEESLNHAKVIHKNNFVVSDSVVHI